MLFSVAAASTDAFAHEAKEGNIWAMPGLLLHRTISSRHVSDDPYDVGGGVVAQGDVDFNGGVEIGLLYTDKTYVREHQDDVVVESIKRMYITTGYRHWFRPWLSSGLAIFSSYSMGDATLRRDDRPSGEVLLTTAHDITEYGLDWSLQWEIWGTDWLAIVADARYSQSLTRKAGEDADVYGLLLGVKYLVPKG